MISNSIAITADIAAAKAALAGATDRHDVNRFTRDIANLEAELAHDAPAAQQFIVTVENKGNTFWLGGTVWRFVPERGTIYASHADAQAALDKARPFMVASIYRKSVISELVTESTDPLDDFNYVGSRHHY